MGITMSSAAGPPDPAQPARFGIIGGSGVQVEGKEAWCVKTPFGQCLISALDDDRRVLFANRHQCTSIDAASGKATYAPPHEVNYQALIWALCVEEGCSQGIVAIGSTGSLHPETIPVGTVLMADDYYMVRPEPVTFWGHQRVGSFAPPEDGGIGRVHYTPADILDKDWVAWRRRVQVAMRPVLADFGDRLKLAHGQTPEIWPCAHGTEPGRELRDSVVYVNSVGPRFETRAEIRAYRAVGHLVGMTCGREWALCEELSVPYCLLCFCDNACNGLSKHPEGALQEYLEHKQGITEVTEAVVKRLVGELTR